MFLRHANKVTTVISDILNKTRFLINMPIGMYTGVFCPLMKLSKTKNKNLIK